MGCPSFGKQTILFHRPHEQVTVPRIPSFQRSGVSVNEPKIEPQLQSEMLPTLAGCNGSSE